MASTTRRAPAVESCGNQFTGTPGAAAASIALACWHLLQATGLGHFDDCGATLRQPAPASLDVLPQWPAHGLAAQFTAAGGQDHLHGAFATVGHWALDQFSLRPRFAQARSDGAGDTGSVEAVLERVGGNDDLHGVSPVLMSGMLTGGSQGDLGQMHKTPAGLFGQMPFACSGPIAGK